MVDISQYNKVELLALNQAVVDRIRELNNKEKATAIRNFESGDSVTFLHRGIAYTGVVTKVLRTNVDVMVDTGKIWRVPANLLTLN